MQVTENELNWLQLLIPSLAISFLPQVEDFVFSSSIIEENILNIVLGSISQTSLIVFTLVGFVVVVAISAYYIGFYQTARQYELDNTGLIALLYTIPSAERQKVSELNTFIESGGAVLN